MAQFKLVETFLFWWPVVVETPDQDQPGKFSEETLEVEFEAITRDEAKQRDEHRRTLSTAVEQDDHEHDFLLRVIRNWRGVLAEDGSEIPFSEATLRWALQFAWFRAACFRAYRQSMTGEEPRLGN